MTNRLLIDNSTEIGFSEALVLVSTEPLSTGSDQLFKMGGGFSERFLTAANGLFRMSDQ